MSSTKRKAVESTLQRRVRARRDPSEEPEEISDAPSETRRGGEVSSEEGSDVEAPKDDDSESNDANESDTSNSEPEPSLAASISFGALAKAQASLKNPKTVKLSTKLSKNADGWDDNEALERKAGRKDHRDFNRASKHAPAELSSKKAVSRKREVVPVTKRMHRDPRFEPINGPVDTSLVTRKYAFLDSYREDEMKDLREQIKKSKDEAEKERLKRMLLSMESRKKADARKAKEQEILDRHRKEEKEAVRMGKQPFYLKKAEQKKQFLVEQYAGLKGKQLDRVVERRRKKVEGKEKKKMPYARREVTQ